MKVRGEVDLGTRVKVALACVPSWLAGVIVSVLLLSVIGEIRATSGGLAPSSVWLPVMLFLVLYLTSPILLICMVIVFRFPVSAVRHAPLFAVLGGGVVPFLVLLVNPDAIWMLELVISTVPGVVSTTLVFRRLVRFLRIVDPA